MTTPTEYPLAWPHNWPVNKRPSPSSFNTSLAGALKNVKKSLELLAKDSGKRVADIVVSSNVTLSSQSPSNAGVAVYFSWDGVQTCIPVDRYNKVACNLQAIHHVIEADRTKMRHGGLHLVRAAYEGVLKLDAPFNVAEWHAILGVSPEANKDIVHRAYKNLRSTAHPDKGGNADYFIEIQKAYDYYCNEVAANE